MKSTFRIFLALLILSSCTARKAGTVTDSDRKKDIELQTTSGTMVLRLSDSTPLHRDNFLKLANEKFFDSLLFHRVIKQFMIQGGDPLSKNAAPTQMLGSGDNDAEVVQRGLKAIASNARQQALIIKRMAD